MVGGVAPGWVGAGDDGRGGHLAELPCAGGIIAQSRRHPGPHRRWDHCLIKPVGPCRLACLPASEFRLPCIDPLPPRRAEGSLPYQLDWAVIAGRDTTVGS